MPDSGTNAADALEAERALLREAVRRQRILAEVSRVLLDYAGEDEIEPLRRIVDMVVEAMGDWCAFALIDHDGILRNSVTSHPDPRQREMAVRANELVPPKRWDRGPIEHNALVQKRPIYFEHIPDELPRAGTPSDDAYQLLREIGLTSVITAPMFISQEPLGTLTLASTGQGGRRYTQNDVDFVFSLADRAALAVRNARLVRALNHQRIEAETRAAELLAVLRSDPNGVALYGPDDKLRFASPTLDTLFGYPLSRETGRHFRELIDDPRVPGPEGERETRLRELEMLFADRESVQRHEVQLAGPPRRHLLRTTTPVTGPAGAYLGRLFVYLDITPERELDQKRADFLTVAAHELRTPLTPLSMYLQTIERNLARDQPIDPELLAKARRQVSRLEKLVLDLLDVSRLDSGRIELRKQPLALDELAGEVAADFRAAARLHQIELQKPAHPVMVEADRERLEQVLVNLLSNAVKYSPQGGRIGVTVEQRAGEAMVSVSDCGIGVPADERDRLFRRFFRARNAATSHYGGLGIGLFVSHQIVERHGGRFEVDSELGKGTTFRFLLPLAKKDVEGGGRRILLVDDDADILEATAGFLQDEGYLVDQARDGERALELVRACRPDLMLIDLMMPVLDGWQLIARLREDHLADGVPVVVFSADRDVRKKAGDLHADATLRKPFSIDELLELVAQLLPAKQ